MAVEYPYLLTLDNINPNIQKIHHPARGPLLIRAVELEKELKNVSMLKFPYFIY